MHRWSAIFLLCCFTAVAAGSGPQVLVSWDGPGALWYSTNLSDWTACASNTSPVIRPLIDHEFFRVLPTPTGVVISWDASPSPDVAGYNLYSGTASRTYTLTNDVGTNLTWVLLVTPGATEYFCATAYDGAGLESDYSNEVSYTADLPGPATIKLF